MQAPTLTAVPLLLGVTGHQDIDPGQYDALRNAVRKVLTQLSKDYPHTPLVLLSPLVPGGDQLVAETAQELAEKSDIDIQLVPVLPWPCEWTVAESRCQNLSEFVSTPADHQQIVTVPLPDGVTQADIQSDPEARDAQREQAGRYIARHSQILFALWDGDEADTSHTASVVKWQSRGGKAPFTVRVGELDTVEGAAVCHLPVRRTGKDAASSMPAEDAQVDQAEPIEVKWIYPRKDASPYVPKQPKTVMQRFWYRVRLLLLWIHRLPRVVHRKLYGKTPRGEQQLKDRWAAIERFNRDIATLPAVAADELHESRGYLTPNDSVQELSDPVRKLREMYALADISALRHQMRTQRVGLWLFGIALCAVAALETYAHLWHEWPVLLAYLLLLAGGFLIFRRIRKQQVQGRWLDNRAFAEALRVQVYWNLAGLSDCVADHYLRHFRGDLDWIRHATRAVFLISGGHAVTPHVTPKQDIERLHRVHTCWIQDQHDFFEAKSPMNSEMEASFETGAKIAFFGAVVVTGYMLWYHLQTHHMSHVLVLCTFGCLVAAAMLEEYAELHAYALLGRRYGWMTDLYGNALHRIEEMINNGDSSQVRIALFELGREALTENADWVIQHRQRPPVLPKG